MSGYHPLHMPTLPLDLFSPDYVQNPEPMIDRMLAEAPVCFDERLNGWLVGRHADIKALEREPRLTSQRSAYVSALMPQELHARVEPLVSWYAGWMVMRDGGDHRRLRRLAAHAFTPRALESLTARIDAVAGELIDAAIAKGEIEVLGDLAYPLPRRVICEMVGLPETDSSKFVEWTTAINSLLSANLHDAAAIDRVDTARRELQAYFGASIDDRRQHPREGELLSNLVQAADEGETFTVDEVIDLVAFILAGAYDTTTHIIANGLLRLLECPEQYAAIRSDHSLVDGWVEETLRYDPSLTINTRTVAEAFDFRGHAFQSGQMVYLVALAANRDPERFPDPHRFDVTRKNSDDHVSFGFGPHFCIGAPLARLEARRLFLGLMQRTKALRLPKQEIRRIPNMVMRGLLSLRMEVA
jgi:cytochrome P450